MVKLLKNKANALILLGLISSSVVAKNLHSVESTSYSNLKLTAEVCQAVKEDELAKLRKTLKDAKLRLINIYDEARCHGVEIFEFAVLNRAEKVKQYILSRAGIKVASKDPKVDSSSKQVAIVGQYMEPEKSE